MKKIITAIVMAISLATVSCPHQMVTPMPPDIKDQSFCKAACDHIGPTDLRCDEGMPIVMKGICNVNVDCDQNQTCQSGRCQVTCEQFCIDTENAGIFLSPSCVVGVTSCSQINDCPKAIPRSD